VNQEYKFNGVIEGCRTLPLALSAAMFMHIFSQVSKNCPFWAKNAVCLDNEIHTRQSGSTGA
jgi:hypothetical protein